MKKKMNRTEEESAYQQMLEAYLPVLEENINMRLICDMTFLEDTVLQVERIAITKIEFPIFGKTRKKNKKKRKKGFLWQLLNNLRV